MVEILVEEKKGAITCVPGIMAAGVHAGIKKCKPDLALLFSRCPAEAAGVFTSNLVKAAPVIVSKEVLGRGKAQAVVVNSGNANACTGRRGLEDARRMTEAVGRCLGIPAELVVVASTGVIGVPLPMEKVEQGIKKAAAELSPQGGSQMAEAIMTTDTRPKEVLARVHLNGKVITVGAVAKGSGMIAPNLATMLAFIATDAVVPAPRLRQVLARAVHSTFNMLTVDGDTSTNDMVVLLANGVSQMELEPEEQEVFQQAVSRVCLELTKMIARDGEGATKLVEVRVEGARTEEDARLVAKAVANSNLVKTALFGADANWGRIITAAGYSRADFCENKVDIYLGAKGEYLQVACGGVGLNFDEARARNILKEDQVLILIRLNSGLAQAVAWTCDLSYDYVRINAAYRT